jgi:hypothetical protein
LEDAVTRWIASCCLIAAVLLIFGCGSDKEQRGKHRDQDRPKATDR